MSEYIPASVLARNAVIEKYRRQMRALKKSFKKSKDLDQRAQLLFQIRNTRGEIKELKRRNAQDCSRLRSAQDSESLLDRIRDHFKSKVPGFDAG